MNEELNPAALAEWGQEAGSPPEERRAGVQTVTEEMILQYVLDNNELPDYSARPFAAWLDSNWFQYSEPSAVTNKEVIDGALMDWRGGYGPGVQSI